MNSRYSGRPGLKLSEFNRDYGPKPLEWLLLTIVIAAFLGLLAVVWYQLDKTENVLVTLLRWWAVGSLLMMALILYLPVTEGIKRLAKRIALRLSKSP